MVIAFSSALRRGSGLLPSNYESILDSQHTNRNGHTGHRCICMNIMIDRCSKIVRYVTSSDL